MDCDSLLGRLISSTSFGRRTLLVLYTACLILWFKFCIAAAHQQAMSNTALESQEHKFPTQQYLHQLILFEKIRLANTCKAHHKYYRTLTSK